VTRTAQERAHAVAATDSRCPRCGTAREGDQKYCLECGLPLPVVVGRVPAMRRRWLRHFGWYPGDWVWAALLALVVASAGAAAAIVASGHRSSSGPKIAVATAGVSVAEPLARVTAGTTTRSTVATSKLPTAPEQTAALPSRITWPASENGWTIVLVSYPKSFGRPQAVATAARAAKAHLNQVGVIDSSHYASLQPGYFVVFTGVYGSKADADAAVPTVKQAGFAGAYSREIAR
jgi:hypothetical protein